jgi:hypothetical protein
MADTILNLSQIGENIFVREYPWEYQAWRWCFVNGVAWNTNGDPVFNYAASFTLYSFLDLRHMTLFLVYGTEFGDSPFLANITLQGVYSSNGFGKGSISAASKEYEKSIGATFEIETHFDDAYKYQLKIARDLFQDQASPKLSEEALMTIRVLATESIAFSQNRNRWPPIP